MSCLLVAMVIWWLLCLQSAKVTQQLVTASLDATSQWLHLHLVSDLFYMPRQPCITALHFVSVAEYLSPLKYTTVLTICIFVLNKP